MILNSMSAMILVRITQKSLRYKFYVYLFCKIAIEKHFTILFVIDRMKNQNKLPLVPLNYCYHSFC